VTNASDRDTSQLRKLERRFYLALIFLVLACILALLFSIILDVRAKESLAGLPITSNWLASILAVPVPILLSIILFNKIQRDYESIERIKASLEEKRAISDELREVELRGVLPRMAELRGALERSLFGNYVRNAALRKVLKTLQERIQDSDDPIMLPLEDDMSDALHEINTVAGEKESILETAARLQEKLQSLLAFDISDKTREAVDAIAESLGA
jgi:hypothetical protein